MRPLRMKATPSENDLVREALRSSGVLHPRRDEFTKEYCESLEDIEPHPVGGYVRVLVDLQKRVAPDEHIGSRSLKLALGLLYPVAAQEATPEHVQGIFHNLELFFPVAA